MKRRNLLVALPISSGKIACGGCDFHESTYRRGRYFERCIIFKKDLLPMGHNGFCRCAPCLAAERDAT